MSEKMDPPAPIQLNLQIYLSFEPNFMGCPWEKLGGGGVTGFPIVGGMAGGPPPPNLTIFFKTAPPKLMPPWGAAPSKKQCPPIET